MATITLKNIPDRLYERLKYFAKLRHRSLNSEIIGWPRPGGSGNPAFASPGIPGPGWKKRTAHFA